MDEVNSVVSFKGSGDVPWADYDDADGRVLISALYTSREWVLGTGGPFNSEINAARWRRPFLGWEPIEGAYDPVYLATGTATITPIIESGVYREDPAGGKYYNQILVSGSLLVNNSTQCPYKDECEFWWYSVEYINQLYCANWPESITGVFELMGEYDGKPYYGNKSRNGKFFVWWKAEKLEGHSPNAGFGWLLWRMAKALQDAFLWPGGGIWEDQVSWYWEENPVRYAGPKILDKLFSNIETDGFGDYFKLRENWKETFEAIRQACDEMQVTHTITYTPVEDTDDPGTAYKRGSYGTYQYSRQFLFYKVLYGIYGNQNTGTLAGVANAVKFSDKSMIYGAGSQSSSDTYTFVRHAIYTQQVRTGSAASAFDCAIAADKNLSEQYVATKSAPIIKTGTWEWYCWNAETQGSIAPTGSHSTNTLLFVTETVSRLKNRTQKYEIISGWSFAWGYMNEVLGYEVGQLAPYLAAALATPPLTQYRIINSAPDTHGIFPDTFIWSESSLPSPTVAALTSPLGGHKIKTWSVEYDVIPEGNRDVRLWFSSQLVTNRTLTESEITNLTAYYKYTINGSVFYKYVAPGEESSETQSVYVGTKTITISVELVNAKDVIAAHANIWKDLPVSPPTSKVRVYKWIGKNPESYAKPYLWYPWPTEMVDDGTVMEFAQNNDYTYTVSAVRKLIYDADFGGA